MTGSARSKWLVVAVTLLITGCGGLLGGGDHPATLYRFGNAPAPVTTQDNTTLGQIRSVSFRGAVFPVESRGDRILTTRGSSAAYVADSRWIAPATELFNTALKRQFTRSQTGVRLVGSAEGPRADLILSIQVTRFEAAYNEGLAPVVAMEANVKLMRWADRAPVGEWTFVSRKPAAENRVASIVSAYDEATNEIIEHIDGAVNRLAGNGPVPLSLHRK